MNRQYPYIHLLERTIAPDFNDDVVYRPDGKPLVIGNVYQREGQVYLNEYPVLLNVAWFACVLLFPAIVSVATIGLSAWEWSELPYTLFHQIFDSCIAAALLSFFYLYQVHPYVADRWYKHRTQHSLRRARRAECDAAQHRADRTGREGADCGDVRD